MSAGAQRVDKEYIFSEAELTHPDMPVLLLGGTKDAIRPMEAVVARMETPVPSAQHLIAAGTRG